MKIYNFAWISQEIYDCDCADLFVTQDTIFEIIFKFMFFWFTFAFGIKQKVAAIKTGNFLFFLNKLEYIVNENGVVFLKPHCNQIHFADFIENH